MIHFDDIQEYEDAQLSLLSYAFYCFLPRLWSRKVKRRYERYVRFTKQFETYLNDVDKEGKKVFKKATGALLVLLFPLLMFSQKITTSHHFSGVIIHKCYGPSDTAKMMLDGVPFTGNADTIKNVKRLTYNGDKKILYIETRKRK